MRAGRGNEMAVGLRNGPRRTYKIRDCELKHIFGASALALSLVNIGAGAKGTGNLKTITSFLLGTSDVNQ